MATQAPGYIGLIANLPVGSTLSIPDVPWEEYEQLLTDLGESSAVRVSYDSGRLEIMSPSSKHEKRKGLISDIGRAISNELDCEVENFGATTFKEKQWMQGAEPDICFYVQNAAKVGDKEVIDLHIDPPPDIVVEIDVSRESTKKLSFYAKLGVPEIWRYDGQKMHIYGLAENQYSQVMESRAFPFLAAEVLTRFLDECKTQSQTKTVRSFTKWLRNRLKENH